MHGVRVPWGCTLRGVCAVGMRYACNGAQRVCAGGVCAMGRRFACCEAKGMFTCCGVEGARVVLPMGMRYTSSGMWGMHAMRWWGGEEWGTGQCVQWGAVLACYGVQCLLAMGCRMHVQWDMVTPCNKGCVVHPVGFGPHMQQGTEVSPAGSRACVLWGRSGPCSRA